MTRMVGLGRGMIGVRRTELLVWLIVVRRVSADTGWVDDVRLAVCVQSKALGMDTSIA